VDNDTVPSTIGDEKAFNPFLRCGEATVAAFAGNQGDDVSTLGSLRKLKDSFGVGGRV